MLKMLFQAAQNWKQQREAGKVTISLRVALMLCLLKELQNSLEECAGGRRSEGRSVEARMDEGRGGCFGPFLGQSIMKWDPEKQKQVESAGNSVKDSKALDLIDRLRTTLPLETVLQPFHWTRPMAESYKSPVLPFLMTIGIRSAPDGASTRGLLRPDRVLGSEDDRAASNVLATTFQNSRLCDWKKREDRWTSRSSGVTRMDEEPNESEQDKDKLLRRVGETIAVPFFDHKEGTLARSMEPFRVMFVVLHLGSALTSGHYKAAPSVPGAPNRASAKDLQDIAHNGYAVGLIVALICLQLFLIYRSDRAVSACFADHPRGVSQSHDDDASKCAFGAGITAISIVAGV
ncbi:unnamed protein product [Symbiodinium microadriaticum]|nr:unnamed protein product [Symbiodinium microadriaticum]